MLTTESNSFQGRIFDWQISLNLTVATRIHIVEPQWNPSIESQAIGRAIRLGQQKQVTVIRYVMQNTVEQVGVSRITYTLTVELTFWQIIQSRQTHKLQLAELGFDAADEEPEEDGLKKSMVRHPIYLIIFSLMCLTAWTGSTWVTRNMREAYWDNAAGISEVMASLSQNNLALKLVLENLLCPALEAAYGSFTIYRSGRCR